MIRRGSKVTWEGLDLLRELRGQLPGLHGATRVRTLRAIRQVEGELARGPGREAEVLRQLDLEGAGR